MARELISLPYVLFSTNTGVLTVLDIPRSIAASQQGRCTDKVLQILSSCPIDTPWPSLEPKTLHARYNCLARIDQTTQERNKVNAKLIKDGLELIRRDYSGPWYYARAKTITDSRDEYQQAQREPPESLTRQNLQRSTHSSQVLLLSKLKGDKVLTHKQIGRDLVINDDDHPSQLIYNEGHHYIIPPRASFCIDEITTYRALSFTTLTRSIYSEPSLTAAPGQFDIILMDPPWPNKSVRRGKQYETFHTGDSHDPLTAVASILPDILAPGGLLAIWVTNKTANIDQAHRIFEQIGYSVIEEWIWLKVTSEGEPVYSLDGLYRQPWEICLVGQEGTLAKDDKPAKKFIVACPELHSRKPWIGQMLVERYSDQTKISSEGLDLRKLEVFARCTAAGWCAWGNEAIKFNNIKYWSQIIVPEDRIQTTAETLRRTDS